MQSLKPRNVFISVLTIAISLFSIYLTFQKRHAPINFDMLQRVAECSELKPDGGVVTLNEGESACFGDKRLTYAAYRRNGGKYIWQKKTVECRYDVAIMWLFDEPACVVDTHSTTTPIQLQSNFKSSPYQIRWQISNDQVQAWLVTATGR